jgi:hypothetical protein
MDDKTSGAVNWLLSSAELAVRLLARREPNEMITLDALRKLQAIRQ